jgi:hypothetical protein
VDGRARETREKTRKGKMEKFNEEVTRGIRTANFASVRVLSGGLIPDGRIRETPVAQAWSRGRDAKILL